MYPANALPWIVIGDSIISNPTDGVATDLPFMLIGQEREIEFRSLASPGATLGTYGEYGFNGAWVETVLDQICGAYLYCDGVIIQAGLNDFNGSIPWSEHRDAMRRILDWAQRRGKRVLVLDLIWSTPAETRGVNNVGLSFRDFREARQNECRARAEVCTFAPRPPEFDRPNPQMFRASEVETGLLTHLNPTGRRVFASWIKDAAGEAGLF